MYKVTDLTKKGKNYLVKITQEKKVVEYKVSEDLVIEFRLLVGKEFDEKQMNKLNEAINKDAYYQKVLHYALFKPRTKKEIFTYLEKLKIEDFGYYLTKLDKLRLINDQLYAANYVSDAINFKRIGKKKILEDLKSKGIKLEDINFHLNQYSSALLEENIQYWLDKKLKITKNKPYYQIKKMIITFLLNKGFDYEDVNSVFSINKEIIANDVNEETLIIKEISYLKTKYLKKEQKLTLNQYLTNKLLAKGYQYSIIKKYLEGSLLGDE